MNENLDLTIILDGCPKGTKFYSVIYGECSLVEIFDNLCYPICLKAYSDKTKVENRFDVTKDGRYFHNHNGECTLFPSKDQRDWSKFERFWVKPNVEKFDPKTLKPFDKVLGFYEAEGGGSWECALFSHLVEEDSFPVVCVGIIYTKCIPYNEETKHLIGTNNDCPDYYKWWEE